MSKRTDWLLQLIDEKPIDPIRIQKGMFLFAKESGAPERETYDFIPYNWGPCSFDIYSDLDSLIAEGLVERVPVPGASWYCYRRTADGNRRAVAVARRASPIQTQEMEKIRSSVQTKSFDRLLQSVYRKYPEYATKSLFRRR